MSSYDAVIVGGGFYGLRIAIFLKEKLNMHKILLIEGEKELMSRASYVNQARVHSGYHYPRSILTAYRSHLYFSRFTDEYSSAIKSDFEKYYAIAKYLSKINSKQFTSFCKKIGAEYKELDENKKRLFNKQLIENVYRVKEYAFNAVILKKLMLSRLKKLKGIKIKLNEKVTKIKQKESSTIETTTNSNKYSSKYVFNCTYSQINNLHRKSNLELLPLKHEITEMCLVDLPPSLKKFSVTVMDGPFFSIMPFPSTKYHSLSHVRYTPHMSWLDNKETETEKIDPYKYHKSLKLKTNYMQMSRDAKRYIPELQNMTHKGSLWEVKTVLVKSEDSDSRPILFRSDLGIRGYVCIMGGKVDNIYDALEEIRLFVNA